MIPWSHWLYFLAAFAIVTVILGAAAVVEDWWQRRKRKETGKGWLVLAAVSFVALVLLLGVHFARA